MIIESFREEETFLLGEKIGREATFIGCNSAVIYENGKIVYEDLLDGEEIIKLMERIESRFDPSNYVVMTENYNTYIYSRKYKPSFRTYLLKIYDIIHFNI